MTSVMLRCTMESSVALTNSYQRQRNNTDGCDSNDKLQAELPRVAYAAAELQKYSKGEVGDTRSVRAARVYLRALSFFISNRERSEPRIR